MNQFFSKLTRVLYLSTILLVAFTGGFTGELAGEATGQAIAQEPDWLLKPGVKPISLAVWDGVCMPIHLARYRA